MGMAQCFLKKRRGFVSAYFISFLFIIYTIREGRNIDAQSTFSDVSSKKDALPDPPKVPFTGAGGQLMTTADGLPRVGSYTHSSTRS